MDKTLDIELILQWVKTLGPLGWKLMYFACEKDMNFEGPKGGVLQAALYPLKIH